MFTNVSGSDSRRDSANHCLSIDEVVRTIAEFLGLICRRSHESRRWSSLVKMALTCRMLYEPAMDALWKEAGSLHYLVRCFPEDVLDYYVDTKWECKRVVRARLPGIS